MNKKCSITSDTKKPVNHRNGRIDFLRFVFAFIIVLHHTRYLFGDENCIFLGGSLGVEFFFIVSGFLMMGSIERMGRITQASVADETLRFLKKKFMGIFPECLVAELIGFVVIVSMRRIPVQGAARLFIDSFWEMTLTRMSGIFVDGFNGVIWYISSMFICMAILFPLIRRFPDMMKKIVCPLAALLLMGFLCQNNGHPRDPSLWLGLVFKGNIRAFAELCIGVVCYQVWQRMEKINWNKRAEIWIEILQDSLYVLIIGYMFLTKPSTEDYFVIVLMSVAVILSFSGRGAASMLFQHKFAFSMGKFSMALYFSHIFYAQSLNYILPENLAWYPRLGVYLCCVFVTALVVQKVSDILRHNSGRMKTGLCRLFTE